MGTTTTARSFPPRPRSDWRQYCTKEHKSISVKPQSLMQYHAIVTPATWCHNGTTALFRNATIILPQSCDHRWTSLGAGVNTPKMHLGQLWSVRPHPEAVTFLQQCVQACVLDNIDGPPTQLTSSVLWKKELVSVVPVMDGFMANKAGSDITCLCDVVSMFV